MTSRMWTANRRLRRLLGEVRFMALYRAIYGAIGTERPMVRTADTVNARRRHLLNERSRRIDMRAHATDTAEQIKACESCGRNVVVSNDRQWAGKLLACDCGGGMVYACRDCMRHGFGSDPYLIDLPYCKDGIGGTLAGPARRLPR